MNYHFTNLKNHPELLKAITQLEEKMNQVLGDHVVLIAYSEDERK
ncbi:hypothetical protein [Tepidibacillus fermentans]|uniref:Uncharacterized protein n=1 Tax=Tepidibacillus fermentans TaxID=1281767 RepID=A0A4R3KA85_9BACI|nr:hypothetical protein [Tepidibacillus fermentans]TCS79907.1 hypothetical protein EDD72_11926 [Tepidibacillus fermentans]